MPFPKLPDFLGRLPRFGDLLRDHRTLRGVTIEQLATETGVAPGALREIEAGTRSAPSKKVVMALADALQISGEERGSLLSASEMDSLVLNTLRGKTPVKPTRPALMAAILVFLIADIRGYTHFTQEFGDEAAARLTERFAELARGALEHWDGQLVEIRGDEILCVFASARQALHAAHEIHARYAEEARTHPDLPPGVGIGLDIGEAATVDGGYRGAALNRAARLCSLAGPGEVLVSPGVMYVAPQVSGVTFVTRGQEQLKGFDAPMPVLLATASVTIEAGEDPLPTP
jgi:class 3 adenylate cyclase